MRRCLGLLLHLWALALNSLDAFSSLTSANPSKKSLGFLSFDLDDTLFPTSQVVNDANVVMIDMMKMNGYETTVSDFLETTRVVRKSLELPITYSDLRRLAIRKEMERVCPEKIADDLLVEQTFAAWLQERHLAAERYLFHDAIEMLEQIKRNHPDVCIAAITNGRGDPLDMKQTLSPYFEFCVSGEEENVFPDRKPYAGIYQRALEKYREMRPDHDPDCHIWCHVGDCLANDVGASASLGARAIWYAPNESSDESTMGRLTGQSTPSWSTATQSELQTRAALVDQARAQVGAQIASLAELPTAIQTFLNDGTRNNL